jgi:hypothetical protein
MIHSFAFRIRIYYYYNNFTGYEFLPSNTIENKKGGKTKKKKITHLASKKGFNLYEESNIHFQCHEK